MFQELEAAVKAVSIAKAKADATAAAAQDAAVIYETAVTAAKAAHEVLVKGIAEVVPGIAQVKRVV